MMRFVLPSVFWIVLASTVASASPMTTTVQLRRVIAEANASDGQGQFGHPSEVTLEIIERAVSASQRVRRPHGNSLRQRR